MIDATSNLTTIAWVAFGLFSVIWIAAVLFDRATRKDYEE